MPVCQLDTSIMSAAFADGANASNSAVIAAIILYALALIFLVIVFLPIDVENVGNVRVG